MNLFHIRYFVKLAEVGNYTKAAQELHIMQPGLSHAISQLENELGVPLFEKNGRNTTLTRFGDEFLACTKQTISTLDGGVDSIQREARDVGVIRVGFLRAFGTQFVPQFASQFLKENKDKIDELINKYAKNWSVNRMPKVDLSILRLAICELVFIEEIPSKVSINEAIELAKLYCDDKAPKFINGILGSVVNEFETK